MFGRFPKGNPEEDPNSGKKQTRKQQRRDTEFTVYNMLLSRRDFMRSVEIVELSDNDRITVASIIPAIDRLFRGGAILRRHSLLDRAVIVTNADLDFPDFAVHKRTFDRMTALGLNRYNWMVETTMYAALDPDGSWPSFLPEGIEPFVPFEVPIVDHDI